MGGDTHGYIRSFTARVGLVAAMWFMFLLVHVVATVCGEQDATPRYFIYSVNPGEGFNLRRDVHMRAANLVLNLRRAGQNWTMVLPPWPRLYHWQSRGQQQWIKWSKFFDLPSLNEHVPSIEFDDFLSQSGNVVDKVMCLRNADWSGGDWRERCDEVKCDNQLPLRWNKKSQQWTGGLFGHKYVTAQNLKCFSVLGKTSVIVEKLDKTEIKSVLVTRMETLLHDEFGGEDYWMARRSMVYSQQLREEGNRFMRDTLHYEPGKGNGRQSPHGGGGSYIAVHLRRQDYIRAHPDSVPSLQGAASQINKLKQEEGIDIVFLSSDALFTEKQQLQEMVSGLVWYQPTASDIRRYGDGGVAIIDQWIASHAAYFVGTAESTFSFRIREDRQFMGFTARSTFNQLCGPGHDDTDPHSCPGPSKWLLPNVVNTEKVEL